MKYKLTRLNDGLEKYGNSIAWIQQKLDGNSKYKHPAKGRCLVIFRGMDDYWRTTELQSFIKEKGVILFTTLNSNYKLEKL